MSDELLDAAKQLASNCFTIEEFLAKQFELGHISSAQFKTDEQHLLLHGHCQQKAMVGVQPAVQALSMPANYHVQVVPSGCCGMAGSFGYEKEHYDLSQQIGELVLFPAVRKAKGTTLVVAAGTSCRHQIKDGTGRTALHPVQVLLNALA